MTSKTNASMSPDQRRPISAALRSSFTSVPPVAASRIGALSTPMRTVGAASRSTFALRTQVWWPTCRLIDSMEWIVLRTCPATAVALRTCGSDASATSACKRPQSRILASDDLIQQELVVGHCFTHRKARTNELYLGFPGLNRGKHHIRAERRPAHDTRHGSAAGALRQSWHRRPPGQAE